MKPIHLQAAGEFRLFIAINKETPKATQTKNGWNMKEASAALERAGYSLGQIKRGRISLRRYVHILKCNHCPAQFWLMNQMLLQPRYGPWKTVVIQEQPK